MKYRPTAFIKNISHSISVMCDLDDCVMYELDDCVMCGLDDRCYQGAIGSAARSAFCVLSLWRVQPRHSSVSPVSLSLSRGHETKVVEFESTYLLAKRAFF